MRKDAVQNRERLLQAARQLFADGGLDVPLEEIARTAGVSIGTLYNRFPTRDALVEAVFADRVATVADLAERALAMDDAWDGFVAFLTGVCELQAADLGYNDLAARTAPVDGDRGYGLMLKILDRAQRSGELRPDVTLADMAFVLWGVAATIRATHEVVPGAWRRHLALTLDGLRTATAHPLPAPPMFTEQTRAALRKC
ncbi:TetR/AcrR family transcriptional regulator [Nonomuraea glycinis]|uniref:TetR family transcriptional regulator n=1 Tax=Nonomuraea glycinis TaxID=2047744 RepID=A0A918A9X5_9ACTN|nr:helix-turn-helix domain-containing protein [Nonomuraea glycinis]MCA2180793.1 TetR/AcrR family transcriptional regulator [Nonomuraea glycinis]GGP11698.1 TetR family transcriptional regulator [Nonomuraea glycinis]